MNPLPLLDRFAPALGARVAERLWFTIPPHPKGGPEPTTDATDVTLEAVGTTLRGRSWGVAGNPIALLVHGWGGVKEQMTAFVDPLVDAGFEVIAFDGPSHGASGAGRHGPKQTTFIEFMEMLEAITAEFGPLDTVIAHSGGSMATVGALDEGLIDVRQVVLISSFSQVEPFTHVFAQMAGFGEPTRARMVKRVERRVGRPVGEWKLADMAPALGAVRALIVHDAKDAQSPVEHSRELADAWPGAEYLETTGLGHNRILSDPTVVQRAVELASVKTSAA